MIQFGNELEGFGPTAEASASDVMMEEWEFSRAWHKLASPEFVQCVDEAVAELKREETSPFAVRQSKIADGDGEPASDLD